MNDPVVAQNTKLETPVKEKKEISKETPASFFGFTLLALGAALFVRFFIATPFIVSGSSMEHTYENHDYLIVDRVSYRLHEPERGDVIVFELPGQESKDLIKRILGLPGETVEYVNNTVTIFDSAGKKIMQLSEPYLALENIGGPKNVRTSLDKNEYFVLGDNRKVSADSRYWGVLPKKNIVGKVLVRLFPFTAIDLLPGEARY
jgi:signal peptidase I